TGSDKYRRTVWFGLSAVFKYSMITFFAPLLFIKKQYFICFGALAIFLIICAWPAFAGYNIIELYVRYVEVIRNTVDGGCNSFKLAGHDLLQFGFFRISFLNLIGKAFFVITMLWIFWRERNRKGTGLNLLLVVFCFTMLVSYHRLYDNIIVILLLLVKTNFLIRRKDRFNSLICGAFLAFYMIPVSWIFRAADRLGSSPLLAGIFYTSPFGQFQTVLPVIAIAQTLLGIYLLYLYLKSEEEYTFQLPVNNQDKGYLAKNVVPDSSVDLNSILPSR
ncbi:MAG: hypothetical protein PHV82_06225, partial [Victivallaceae bacterium]|nr:hypothetical protein [Victivallaceae bacterium]